ncbi:SUN domain-containing protein 5 isoform X2 [Trachypithecus francoisi]|uniref:SUN domain-containing protein 5 isoform X2 n=1 Tax=Trachypithecus francoisi TaxID=54180 RepID=UPI00141BEBE0|nr:SUN domain-containing protein 5 isoform X2 [Trachypithecus francoisi]
MPRSSRSPGDPGAPLEDVAHNPRPRRIAQRGRNTSRMVEDTSSNMNDNFLLPVRINAQALGLTQCMLGCVSWFTCFACSLRTQAQQVLFNTCRCKLLCQKLMEKTGILLLCAFGFWMFSIHLPSKMKVWQDDSINGPLQSLRLYQEKVRHHSGEIQDLRGSMNLLIAKLQEIEAMSDEQKVAQKIMKMIHGDYIEKPDFALKSTGASIDFEHTSATYNHEKAHSYWNWIQLWNYAQPPDVILEPNVTPGNCWAFEGNRGHVTIQLAQKVYLSNLTLQHIPKTISPSGSLDTAPKDFVIYGMEGSPKEEVFLGAFQFQPENIIQMFPLQTGKLRLREWEPLPRTKQDSRETQRLWPCPLFPDAPGSPLAAFLPRDSRP